MGRKKKVRGTLFVDSEGRRVRITAGYVRADRLLYRHAPRGKTGASWELTTFLKEFAPLVYVFLVNELKKSDRDWIPNFRRIIEEWKQDATPRTKPTARELTAYIIERAMDGAWEVWKLNRPYSKGEHDSFYRRYVHGHRGAIRAYREALHMSQPWPRNHVGHQIKFFLGNRGEAACHYGFLARKSTRFAVITVEEED